MGDGMDEKRQQMSAGLFVKNYNNIRGVLNNAVEHGYHFIVTQIVNDDFVNKTPVKDGLQIIGHYDKELKHNEWNRLIVGDMVSHYNLDSKEDDETIRQSRDLFLKEVGFASHLGVPVVWITLTGPNNKQLASCISEKLTSGLNSSIWINIPMVHPSRFGLLDEEEQDTWEWWNKLHSCCNYDKKLGLALDLCSVKHMITMSELDRWIGEPVKALVIPTSFFLTNQYGKPVLSRIHQDVIKKFMSLDVQYIIKPDTESNLALCNHYIHFLGKKLHTSDVVTEFVQGCEDLIQNPLQPLTENLESGIYEIFEKDQVKYDSYQKAIYKAVEAFPTDSDPVIMVLGAGRGPLVQAVLNVGQLLNRKIKVYAVEKNPYAINTLSYRVANEWHDQVVLVSGDMRYYEPPEKADIIVSELLGSFGDNELSPECLDGAQRFLKPTGLSIPSAYTSYLAPIQSIKLFNDIRTNRPVDKTLLTCYETPYIVHLTNYYQIAPPQELFTFSHPNWMNRTNSRYKQLRFQNKQACTLTGFAGFFDTVLHKDVRLSIHPETHTPDMVSWFPIVFPLLEPIYLSEDAIVEVSFWRKESPHEVWYEWCLNLPVSTQIFNVAGRSYSIKKH